MRTRAGRFVLLALLLAAGIGAAVSSWSIARRIGELESSEQDTAERIDRLLTAVAEVAAGQQASVTRSPDRPAEAGTALIEQIRVEASGLRPHVRSVDAARRLQGIADNVRTLGQVEARAQDHLRVGQDLMAADLISTEARNAADAIVSGLRDLRAAESLAFANARADALENAAVIVGAVAAFWALGLILLTLLPASRVAAESPSSSVVPAIVLRADGDRSPEQTPHPDFLVAADLCTAMGRLTAADDLQGLLKRAASLLDASGIVVWMAAGEELFAAKAVGYQPQVISRLGPINRAATNATAAAWRTGTMQIVSGDLDSRGALVAPMLGPDRCIGVLAIEIPPGRAEDSVTKAVTTMFAAQLAAALAGWPAASAAAPADVPPLNKAAEA
jgi:hypothetical protein